MLIPQAKAILERAKALNPTGEFVFMFDGRQLSISTFNSRLKRYCNELGITPRTSHKIRFCVASVLHKSGNISLPELQKMLGHTEVSTTLHYLRSVGSDDETLKTMIDCLQI
jgi:integrase